MTNSLSPNSKFSTSQFHLMTEDMLDDILIIENLSYPIGWSEQVFKDCLNKQQYFSQVLKDGEKIIGYYVVQKIVDEYHILNICVAPEYLGEGFGRFQLNAIQESAESEFINRILLEVRASNKAARKLYTSSGFHIIGKRKGYYPTQDGREDAHVMELALS